MNGQVPGGQAVRAAGTHLPPPGRKRRSDGERRHRAILEAATRLATERGLEGLAISELAAATGLSKPGLHAHFGSKEQLQMAAIEAAAEIAYTQVTGPALALPEPVDRLRALCENFLIYAQRTFPGGCFFAAAAAEFNTRPGAVRDRIAEYQAGWTTVLTDVIGQAYQVGQLDALGKEPAQLAFELNSYLDLANGAYALHRDPEQIRRARQAISWLLELHTPRADGDDQGHGKVPK
jgi:AcrR family transcriptional regulator